MHIKVGKVQFAVEHLQGTLEDTFTLFIHINKVVVELAWRKANNSEKAKRPRRVKKKN